MSVASPLRAVTLALILAALHCARAEAQEGKCPNATEAEARRLKSEIESLKQRGKWSEAIPQARCLFEVARKLFGPDHATTLNLQYDLAVITRAAGRTAEAAEIEKHADSATRPEKLRSDITDIEILVIQSKSFIDRGDRDEAGRICREARQLATSRDLMRHAIFAAVLNECGRVYELYGNYTMAEQRYLESASLARELGGSRDQQLAVALNNLGSLYWKKGEYRNAQKPLEEVFEIDGKDNPEGIPGMINLALVYEAVGRSEDAQKLYLSARDLTLLVYGDAHPNLIEILDNLAAQAWREGRLEQAFDWQERGNLVAERNVLAVIGLGSERQKLAYMSRFETQTHASVSLSLTEPKRSRRAAEMAFQTVLQRKGRVLDAMSDSVGKLRQSAKPEDRALFEQFAKVAQQRSTLTYQGPGNLPLGAYRGRLAELARQQEALETELAKRSAEFREQIAPITLAAVRSVIPAGAALVEWLRYWPFDPKAKDEKAKWGKPRYVAYVLRHERDLVVVEMDEAEVIDTVVREFRGALSDPKRTDVKELAADLSEKLLKPLRPHLDNANRLLISPDGALNLVPFAALLDEQGRYLATRFEITYLTSGRDLLRFSSESGSRGSAVVVADPDYGKSATGVVQADAVIQPQRSGDLDRSGLVFKPLPGTAEEAKALKALLKVDQENVLTQANATEAKLKQLHGPRILHVATHGFFLNDKEMTAFTLKPGRFLSDQTPVPLGENPLLRSGLALAGANLRRSGANDDGILTAFEAAQLDLRGTQLVVLSACETGVGEVQNGEGVYGLRRALVLAGAQTQVASLWKVADEATKDLMVDYYGRLLKGEGRSGALRDVQRAMIASPGRSHPYYWAGFVPIGNWAPMPALRSRGSAVQDAVIGAPAEV